MKAPTSVKSVRLADSLWVGIGTAAEKAGMTVNAFISEVLNAKIHGVTVVSDGSQASRDAKYLRRDTWDPRFAAAKRGKK